MTDVAVVGLGNMGLPLALEFARHGASVCGADINPGLIAELNSGKYLSGEPGLGELVTEQRRSARFDATTDVTAAVRRSTVVVVIVRLIVDGNGRPDYSALDAATQAIGSGIRKGTLVVFETTVPVGTVRNRFTAALESASSLVAGRDFHVAFSPERVKSTQVLRDLRDEARPKLISGLTSQCRSLAAEFYRRHLTENVIEMSSLETAEFTKIAEGVFRDVNIALANELARYADASGIDFLEVRRAANTQPESDMHLPGVGVGGHCIPVYPHFVLEQFSDARLTALARSVNGAMAGYAADRLEQLMGKISGRRVLVMGLAYRAGVKESTNSSAVNLLAELKQRGAETRLHDPLWGRGGIEAEGFVWSEPTDGFAEGLVLQAAHQQYLELDPKRLTGVKAIVDGRNCLDLDVWRAAGIACTGIGHGVITRS